MAKFNHPAECARSGVPVFCDHSMPGVQTPRTKPDGFHRLRPKQPMKGVLPPPSIGSQRHGRALEQGGRVVRR